MNEDMIFKSFSNLRDDFIKESEAPARKTGSRVFIRRFAAAAACFCVIALSVFTVTHCLPDDHAPENYPPEVLDGETVSPPLSDGDTERKVWEIFYNDVSELHSDSALKQDFCIFGETLTEDELLEIFPQGFGSMELTGTAQYYGWGRLHGVYAKVEDPASGAEAAIKIFPDGSERVFCYVLSPEEAKTSEINGLEFTAYVFEYEDTVSLRAEFNLDGTLFTVMADGETEDAGILKNHIYNVMLSLSELKSTPDLSALTPKADYEYMNEKLTYKDAAADEAFGSFLPASLPDGFYLESAHRYQNGGSNYLSLLWSKGYSDISWRVTYFKPADETRLTDVEDTENYDLSLYPIPRAESVPRDLREIVDDPIFSIEDLTLEAIEKRSSDSDNGKQSFMFSVKYGDVLVSVSAKGVDASWLYNSLIGIAG